jgi:hypothetical protein
MGREAKAPVTHNGATAEARVHLDSDMLTIGPPVRARLALSGITAKAGVQGLTLNAGSERYLIAMSEKEAGAWAKAIANPPTLADKLGIKPGVTLALIGTLPDEIVALAKGAVVAKGAALTLAAVCSLDVKALVKIAKTLPEKGAVWLIYEKGVVKGDALIFAAREAGLKDTKVAKISDTHTGLRFIVRG